MPNNDVHFLNTGAATKLILANITHCSTTHKQSIHNFEELANAPVSL